MKKLLISAIAIFGTASLAYAATNGDLTGTATLGSTGGNMTISLSPNVHISYDANASGTVFEMTSFNDKGTMAYGVNSTSTAVYQKSATAVETADVSDGITDEGFSQMGQ